MSLRISKGIFTVLLSPWLFLLASPAGAAFLKDYTSPLSDVVWDLDATADGGFVFAGSTANLSVSPLLEKGSLVKFDALGNIEWQKLYANSDRNRLINIKQTEDGGYVAALYRPLKAKIPAIVRLDPNGQVLWSKFLDPGEGLVAEYEQPTDNFLERTADNGNVISFWVYNPAKISVQYAWLVKLDDDGNILWQKRYNFRTVGGFRVCADGGIIMTTLANDPQPVPGLVKLDTDGNIVWQKNYVSPAATYKVRFFNNVRQTSDGGFIVCGNATVPIITEAQYGYSLIMKLNSVGDILWQKKIPGIGVTSSPTSSFDVVQIPNGGYIYGAMSSTRGILHLDANGNLSRAEIVDPYYRFKQNKHGELLYVTASFGSSGYNVLPRDFRLSLTDRDGNVAACATSNSLQITYLDAEFVAEPAGYVTLPANGTTGDVTIVAENPTSTFNVVTQCVMANPDIFVGSPFVQFGSVEYGAAETRLILLANDGDAPLTFSSITLGGPVATAFAQTNDCGTLLPGASCQVTISFRPTLLGASEATLVINSNDPDQAVVSLPVSGTGIDTAPPVITLLGDASVILEAGSSYVNDGATAADNYDGDLTAQIVVSGAVDTTTVGSYSVAYDVTDSSGNHAAKVTRSVQVVDTIPPVVMVEISHGALWPPKKAEKPRDLVPLTIHGEAVDFGTGVVSIEVLVTDEYGVYSYTLSGFEQTVGIESWRNGNDADGRHYTIDVIVTDFAGNISRSRSTLTVKHDLGK